MLFPGCHHVQTCECLQTLLVLSCALTRAYHVKNLFRNVDNNKNRTQARLLPPPLSFTAIDQDLAFMWHLCKLL